MSQDGEEISQGRNKGPEIKDPEPEQDKQKLQVDQETVSANPAAKSSAAAMTTSKMPSSSAIRALSSFDRLLPRYSDQYESRKRKSSSEESAALHSDESSAKLAKKSANAAAAAASAKKEYSKLRTLVPALSERQDLSKVEIIEETIRYIDALHHQLAARSSSTPANNHSSANQEEANDDDNNDPRHSESNPENSSPLKTLVCSSRPRRAMSFNSPPASSNLNSATSDVTASTSGSSSSDRSSAGDVKAAVENIQAMFAAYLEQQQGSSSDESTS